MRLYYDQYVKMLTKTEELLHRHAVQKEILRARYLTNDLWGAEGEKATAKDRWDYGVTAKFLIDYDDISIEDKNKIVWHHYYSRLLRWNLIIGGHIDSETRHRIDKEEIVFMEAHGILED